MNILVDLAHPAHFHFFSRPIRQWREEGHGVTITVRQKDVLLDLVAEAGEEAFLISGIRRGRWGQATELVERVAALVPLMYRRKIDVATGVGGVSVSHAASLCGVPSLIWTNNENARLSNRLTLPFATRIATPSSFRGDYGTRHRRYRGNHERAYIPPEGPPFNWGRLLEWGLDPNRLLFVVRLVSWQASHDHGHRGLAREEAVRLIEHLERTGQVVLSTEGTPPEELSKYIHPIPVSRMGELLAMSDGYIGEGATMASECALMGIPNIFFSSIRLGYLNELEQHFGLMRCLSDLDQALVQWDTWMNDSGTRSVWDQRRKRFFRETDPVADLVHDWVLETAR